MVDALMTPHLTEAGDPSIAGMINMSRPGMAHFAGTGPEGETCRSCDFWARRFLQKNEWGGFDDCDDPVITSFKRDPHTGQLSNRSCKKFYRMMQQTRGAPLPADTPACKYFVANPHAPPVEKPAKRAKERAHG